MTKRITIHYLDETGALITSQLRKAPPRIGDVLLMSGTPYVVQRRRDSSVSLDFFARPASAKPEPEEATQDGMRDALGPFLAL